MFLPIAFLSSLAGIGLACAAAWLPDTGVDGTIGAFLAVVGTVGAALTLAVLLIVRDRTKVRGFLAALAALAMVLTALAAWFLMLNGLAAVMIAALLALAAGMATNNRKISQ